jgi:hypothetical protein
MIAVARIVDLHRLLILKQHLKYVLAALVGAPYSASHDHGSR